MPKCCELYNDGLFLGPVRCALLILESGMSTPASFTDLLTLSWIFSDVSSFSHGMLVIRRQVLRLYCSLHSTKCWRYLHFSWRATLLSLSQCIHMLLKQTAGRRLRKRKLFSSSLTICFISSLKTSLKISFIQ